jgi:hypothetical protein
MSYMCGTKNPYMLILGAAIDGCTSYSYPLNQAYIADVVTDPKRLTEAYGLFQVNSLLCPSSGSPVAFPRG